MTPRLLPLGLTLALALALPACPGNTQSPVDAAADANSPTDAAMDSTGDVTGDAVARADAPGADRPAPSDAPQPSPDAADVTPTPLPGASCNPAPGGGSANTQPLVLTTTLADRWHESWLSSPAVADLDRDGTNEIIVPRSDRLLVWHPDGSIAWSVDVPDGRIWSSPLVADFRGDGNLEVVVAARGNVYMFDAAGNSMGGFPVAWRDEIRSLAAGDVDGDGQLEIVAVTTNPLEDGTGLRDIIKVIRADGVYQDNYPPNTTGHSGCTAACYVTGGYDQNVAVGPIDGDGQWDILTGQDDAYLSWHHGNGTAFDAASIFTSTETVLGVRFLFDYAEAQQGWAANEDTALQAHFTNSAPAIADLDGDGANELIVLGSVQNAAQTDRLKGVGLWVLRSDATRPANWLTPFHAPDYLAGLWDYDGTNIVAATNQVSVADLDPSVPGLDMVFAGFDGRIHRVGADARERWAYTYTTSDQVLTGGVLIADLSGDGVPEIVFATYSTQQNAGGLFVLDAAGNLQQRVDLPGRGAMPVPTVADVDNDGVLDVVVSLKDGEDRVRSALVYRVPGSGTNCLPWPTGRGNYLRNGYFRAAR